jgi:EAL domain-containing protein (putative c-di-GMP-specific phosphodiesterase class I)
LNCTLAFYAMVAFVGIRHSIVDLFVQLKAFVYRPVEPKRKSAAPAVRSTSGAIGDWASVLHFDRSDVVTRAVDEQAVDTSVASSRRKALPDWRTKPRPADSGVFEQYTFFTVFQPIVDLVTDEPVGYEALTRFADGQSPQVSLAAANTAGIGVELDAALARAALKSAHSLPEGTWLAVNVSAGLAAQTDKLADVLALTPCPLVIEIGDATDAGRFVEELTARVPDVMFAIDDAGASYESLSRIERLRPSFLKLHRDAVTGIADDAARRSFVKSLVSFAEEHQCQVIAEGVETEAERDALRDAGVHLGQGYYVGRPVPIDRMRTPTPLGAE